MVTKAMLSAHRASTVPTPNALIVVISRFKSADHSARASSTSFVTLVRASWATRVSSSRVERSVAVPSPFRYLSVVRSCWSMSPSPRSILVLARLLHQVPDCPGQRLDGRVLGVGRVGPLGEFLIATGLD